MVRFVRGGRGPGRRWEVVGVLAWRDGPVCVCYRSVCPNVCPGVCSQVFRAICVLCERGVTRVGGPRTLLSWRRRARRAGAFVRRLRFYPVKSACVDRRVRRRAESYKVIRGLLTSLNRVLSTGLAVPRGARYLIYISRGSRRGSIGFVSHGPRRHAAPCKIPRIDF